MKFLHILFSILYFTNNLISQNFTSLYDTTYSVVTISPSQNFYLDSRLVSSVSGRSRLTIPINIPEGTVRWYYSFAAADSKNEPLEWVSLAGQLTKIWDKTGIASEAINRLVKPTGTTSCDVYIIHPEATKAFESKEDDKWGYDKNNSRMNLTSGVVEAFPYASRLQLGVSNPSIKTGINVKIEITAVVAKLTPFYNMNNRQGKINNSLSWTAQERLALMQDIVDRFEGKRTPSVSQMATCILEKNIIHFSNSEFKNITKVEKDVAWGRMTKDCFTETKQEGLDAELTFLRLAKRQMDSLEKNSNFADMLRMARKIEDMYFSSIPNRTRLIRALMLNGLHDEALAMAEPMVRLSPDDMMLNLQLAHLYLFKNETEKAEKIYMKFKNHQNTEGVTWGYFVNRDFNFFIQNKIFNSQFDNIKKKLKTK